MKSPDNVHRFEQSMHIDFEKWHDGIGYDLDALRAASDEERGRIEALLLRRRPPEWRDIEALALLDTEHARNALRAELQSGNSQSRVAVIRFAPQLAAEAERTAALIQALRETKIYGGLTQTLAEVAEYHPPEVIAELFRGVLSRDGEVAVHLAALLLYVHGKTAEPFDWDHRPLFLRFHTTDERERHAAFCDLCALLEVNAHDHLPRH